MGSSDQEAVGRGRFLLLLWEFPVHLPIVLSRGETINRTDPPPLAYQLRLCLYLKPVKGGNRLQCCLAQRDSTAVKAEEEELVVPSGVKGHAHTHTHISPVLASTDAPSAPQTMMQSLLPTVAERAFGMCSVFCSQP